MAEKKEDEKPKIFVGFCRMTIVDSDGLGRKVKGCSIEAPIHQTRGEKGEYILTAEYPRNDPICFLRITCDDAEYLGGCMWTGPTVKADEHINPNRMICVFENANCRKMTSTCGEGSTVMTTKGVIPFIPNAFDRQLPVEIHTCEAKLQTKVVKVQVVIPEDQYNEWQTYYEALSKFDKDKDKDKDKDEEKDKKDK